MKEQEMIQKYAAIAAPETVRKFMPYLRDYIRSSSDFTRESIDRWRAELRARGHSPGTIDWVLRMLKRFYAANGLDWPYRRGEGQIVGEADVYAPALDPRLVRQLIAAARQGVLNQQEAGCLALSTVYGLRRAEMSSILPEHMRLDSRMLYVRTAKYGRQRWHVIPPEILEPLSGLRLPVASPDGLTRMWREIEAKTGLADLRRQLAESGQPCDLGWHAIRRTLDRMLIQAGLPEAAVATFLRWKRSTRDMTRRYYASTVVSPDRVGVIIGAEDREVDEQVFRVHPFLPAWRGDNGASASV